jgi:hypothetical protein
MVDGFCFGNSREKAGQVKCFDKSGLQNVQHDGLTVRHLTH